MDLVEPRALGDGPYHRLGRLDDRPRQDVDAVLVEDRREWRARAEQDDAGARPAQPMSAVHGPANLSHEGCFRAEHALKAEELVELGHP